MIIERAFCDLGVSINLMPLSLMKKLQIHELKPTQIALQIVNKSIKQALGVVENVLVKVGKVLLLDEFVILDMEENFNTAIILGRLFSATGISLIDVEKGELMRKVHDEHIVFHVFKSLQDSTQEKECMKIDFRDPNLKEALNEPPPKLLSPCLKDRKEVEMVQRAQEVNKELQPKPPYETFNKNPLDIKTPKHESPLEKERNPKKKMPRGWRNKKICTKGFSLVDKVMLTYQPIEKCDRKTS
ncbi:uncharacterized protein LOC107465562 [Arachis duranensis]|uniref:Uncharacterized protein LOC107465562 n=1 Tax=Arachis duranensis TaxID=130453 RepID=A0A6P4C1P8_ARADU|nr:uncharacterized protein LOC107465562 [Arachis duranensis]